MKTASVWLAGALLSLRLAGTSAAPVPAGDTVEYLPANRATVPNAWKMSAIAQAYLRKTQDPDGGWSDGQYPSNSGVTALACLAFMIHDRHADARNRKTLERGIAFLLGRARDDGRIVASRSPERNGGVFEHTLATLALLRYLELNPEHARVRRVLERALAAMPDCQRQDGGWRYAFSRNGTSDANVTGHALWALCYAKNMGLDVDTDSIRKATRFIEKCHLPDGAFRYRQWGLYSPQQGLALIALMLSRRRADHPLFPFNHRQVEYRCERLSVQDLAGEPYLHFRAFHEGIAFCMAASGVDDSYFNPWFKKMARVYQATQAEDGSFRDQHGNTVYPTAMTAYVLQLLRRLWLSGGSPLLGMPSLVEGRSAVDADVEEVPWNRLLEPDRWGYGSSLEVESEAQWVHGELATEARLAVVRHQLRHAEMLADGKAAVFFLSVGENANPPKELMHRLAGHKPAIRNRSDAVMSPGAGARDKRTGERGILLAVGPPVWCGRSISLRGTTCAADGGIFLHQYYLFKEGKAWKVHRDNRLAVIPPRVRQQAGHVRKALILRQLRRLKDETGETAGVVFVSFGPRGEPDDDFLVGLDVAGVAFKRRSDAVVSAVEGVRDRETGQGGALLELGPIRWGWSPGAGYTARTRGLVHTAKAGSFRHVYELRRTDGQWTLVREELKLVF